MTAKPLSSKDFSISLLKWAARYGRKNLPWQRKITPYRVWLSEVMLQQTQAATVSSYFTAFTKKFPSVKALAKASLDEVLTLWAGLGYYSRARNLHKAARLMCAQHDGQVPGDLQALQNLPGVGRSTAGAILAIGFSGHAAILDGNVKRVLARYFCVEGYSGQTSVAKILWQHAESLTPKQQAGRYAQAIMDLGALICTRKAPACAACPVRLGCSAFRKNRQLELPAPRPKRVRPVRQVFVLLLQSSQGILLERRPDSGIWAGLWSLPEMQFAKDWPTWFNPDLTPSKLLQTVKHDFTHFKLHLTPVSVQASQPTPCIPSAMMWYQRHHRIGMPAPIKKLLDQLNSSYDTHYSLPPV